MKSTSSGSASGFGRRSRRGRFPLAGVAGVLVAVGIAAALLVQALNDRFNARAAFPLVEGRINVPGIIDSIEIFRDRTGVPHIEAHNEPDAFYGLGFVHAQDRLAQMLWLARIAKGRSAEIIGVQGLASDRLARVLDISGLAEAEVARLDPQILELLEAYAAGVNARIERVRAHKVAPPLALPLIRNGGGATAMFANLEPWTPADSLAILKQYAWGLSGTLDVSLVLSDVVEHMGRYRARLFFPSDVDGSSQEDGTPALAAGAQLHTHAPALGFESRIPVRGSSRRGALRALVPDPLRRASRLEGRSVGSSAWVIGGALTESGRPILVADAHLPPTAPPRFHVDHLRGGGIDVAGSTLPGVPLIWTGSNGRVAWASTHARVVTTDLYEETLHPDDPSRYHNGKGWRKFAERVERIRVRDGEEEVLTVLSSHHGPMIPRSIEDSGSALAIAWTGAELGDTSSLAAFLAVARAQSSEQLVDGLRLHHEPPLTVVYADAQGEMGLQVAGWIPKREFSRGLVPLPGRARWYEWRGPIEFDELPQVRVKPDSDGRAQGWVIAADNRLLRNREPARIEWLWRNGERAGRIDQLLRKRTSEGAVDLRSMAALQIDEAVGHARSLAERALAWTDDDPALGDEGREIAELMRKWDGVASAKSVGAAIYHVFLEHLTEKVFSHQLGEDLGRRYLSLRQADPAQVVYQLLDPTEVERWEEIVAEGGAGAGGEEAPAEIVRRAIRESLRETWFQLSFDLGPNRSRWNWGRLHTLRFAAFQPSGTTTGLSGLGPFSFGGDGNSINTAEYAAGESFDVQVASTFRFAIDAAALDEALIGLAPGQSEHPRHRHFTSGLERWLAGRHSLLATSNLLVEEASASRLTLEPET